MGWVGGGEGRKGVEKRRNGSRGRRQTENILQKNVAMGWMDIARKLIAMDSNNFKNNPKFFLKN